VTATINAVHFPIVRPLGRPGKVSAERLQFRVPVGSYGHRSISSLTSSFGAITTQPTRGSAV